MQHRRIPLWSLFLVLPVNAGKFDDVVFCQRKIYSFLMYMKTFRKFCGNMFEKKKLTSVWKFWVLTRQVPRRKTCRWLAQGITDHSCLAPHPRSATHTHLFLPSRALHCHRSARARLAEGMRAVPSFFGVVSLLLDYLPVLTAAWLRSLGAGFEPYLKSFLAFRFSYNFVLLFLKDINVKFYMFCTVHCIICNENQLNAQMIYIFSICSTYMFRSCLTIIRVRCYRVSNTTICAFVPTRPPHSAHRTF